MEKQSKKRLTIIAIIAGFFGVFSAVISFFIRREKKLVVHNGKKKMLYPQDLMLEKTILQLIPGFISPNYISLLRIAMTPLAAILIANGTSLWIPLIVYLFISFTDMLDGAMARTQDKISDMGKVLDPVADKLLFVFSALFLLPRFGYEELLFVLIGLEAFTIVISAMIFRKIKVVASSVFGKIKLNLQVLGIAMLIIANYTTLESIDLALYGKWVLYASIAFYFFSLVYVVIFNFRFNKDER
jgi:CDP-diacylglycerol---glycerol-3-phosphate 3-phosphatidyltransferase